MGGQNSCIPFQIALTDLAGYSKNIKLSHIEYQFDRVSMGRKTGTRKSSRFEDR
jgi:hypothetical protein